MLGLATVLLLFGLAYLSPVLVTWQYNQLDTSAFLTPPSGAHWFGTTQNGFDIFALTMRGMQKSLVVGLVGALMSTALAAVVGAFAGYFGRRAQHHALRAHRPPVGAARLPHHRHSVAVVSGPHVAVSSSCCSPRSSG